MNTIAPSLASLLAKNMTGLSLHLLTPPITIHGTTICQSIHAKAGNKLMDTHATLVLSVNSTTLGLLFSTMGGLDETKAIIVVTIIGGVPVAVGRTHIVRIIVPGAAAQNTLTLRPVPSG